MAVGAAGTGAHLLLPGPGVAAVAAAGAAAAARPSSGPPIEKTRTTLITVRPKRRRSIHSPASNQSSKQLQHAHEAVLSKQYSVLSTQYFNTNSRGCAVFAVKPTDQAP